MNAPTPTSLFTVTRVRPLFRDHLGETQWVILKQGTLEWNCHNPRSQLIKKKLFRKKKIKIFCNKPPKESYIKSNCFRACGPGCLKTCANDTVYVSRTRQQFVLASPFVSFLKLAFTWRWSLPHPSTRVVWKVIHWGPSTYTLTTVKRSIGYRAPQLQCHRLSVSM